LGVTRRKRRRIFWGRRGNRIKSKYKDTCDTSGSWFCRN